MLPFLMSVLFAAGSLDPSVLTVPIVHAEELPKVWTQEEVKQYALEVATEFGLHKYRFLKTLECENGFNAKGQSNHYYKGQRELSFGAVQINLPSWPGITKEMAEEPTFAIPFMAQKWVENRANLWACYTLFSRQGWSR